MPLFQYTCKACGRESEILVRSSETPVCPGCGSKSLEKQASRFAALSGTKSAPSCASGACEFGAGGACGLDGGCCMN